MKCLRKEGEKGIIFFSLSFPSILKTKRKQNPKYLKYNPDPVISIQENYFISCDIERRERSRNVIGSGVEGG